VAAVEFALVLPVLVLLMFIIIVAGLVYFDNMQVQAAARDGARAGASVPGTGCSAALQRLPANVRSAVTCTQVPTCSTTSNPPITVSTVNLAYNRNVSVPLLGNRTVNLTASSVFECLN
jgi:Flp pilus assembly protein TadG